MTLSSSWAPWKTVPHIVEVLNSVSPQTGNIKDKEQKNKKKSTKQTHIFVMILKILTWCITVQK